MACDSVDELLIGTMLSIPYDYFTLQQLTKPYVFCSVGSEFIVSLFVLSGDFWEKFRSLFIYDR